MSAATQWLTPEEVAGILKLQKATILHHCRGKKFDGAKKIGGVWRIPASALEPPSATPLIEPPSDRSLAQQRRRRAA